MTSSKPTIYGAAVLAAVSIAASCNGETDTTSTPADGGDPGMGGAGGMMTMTTSSTGGMAELPDTFVVDGIVIDQDGAPVADAFVLQGGKSHELPWFTTGADGLFSIEIETPPMGIPTVVATKADYRTAGVEFYELPVAPVELTIIGVSPPDNTSYTFADPGYGADPTTNFCGHCHDTFTFQFQTSKHAEAARNPLVQDVYAGVTQAHATSGACVAAGGEWKQGLVPGTAGDPVDKCYLGGGVLPDVNATCGGVAQSACDDPAIAAGDAPSAFGACADCHAPGIDGVAGGRNLHEAVGISFDHGVHCDVCHKVRDVDLGLPPGIGQRLILQRPFELSPSPTQEYLPVYYGPLPDVPNAFMRGGYQPKFKQAVFCAGCHQQNQPALIPGDTLDGARWPDGLPVHTTYEEWEAGPYNDPATPCQFCHMPPNFDLTNTIDTSTVDNQSITFGFPRPAEDIRQHIFRSPLLHGTPRLIDTALFVSVNLASNAGDVDATISIANIGCGHAIPTGEPMRALVMLVEAVGSGCASPLVPSAGMTVQDIGGALASGVEGTDVTTAGTTLTWAAGAAVATAGQVVRVVRPTGVFDDYAGVGFFADPTLTPAEKNLEIFDPVGTATVVSAGGGDVVVDTAVTVAVGDVFYLGEAVAFPLTDGQTSLRVAGAPGYTFSKILTDNAGTRAVAHYRAIDIASDNRIPPGDNALTTHTFSNPGGCTSATVTAVMLYRPHPTAMAALRGWTASDYVIASGQATISLP